MRQLTLVIIGGANGSGKTTLAREFVALEKFTYHGADEIARELNPQQPEKVAIEAARLFSQRFGKFVEKRESLIVESTLSGLSLQRWIEKARGFGYAVKILFVYLSSPQLCVQRVAARVAKGGTMFPKLTFRDALPTQIPISGMFIEITPTNGTCFITPVITSFKLRAATAAAR